MKRVCKIRIYPNETQKKLIETNLSACNFVWNKYLEANKKAPDEKKDFISAYDFRKELNVRKKEDPDYIWLKEASTKATSDAIITAEKAFKAFFKGIRSYPRFKSKRRNNLFDSYYFIKDGIKFYMDIPEKKNKIKIPILGEIRVTRKEYLPMEYLVSSGRVIKSPTDKYYVAFTYDIPEYSGDKEFIPGIKVKMSMDPYVSVYDENDILIEIYPNFIYQDNYKKIDDRLYGFQCIISKKANISYDKAIARFVEERDREPDDNYKDILKAQCYNSGNIQKVRVKLNRCFETRTNIANDAINKIVADIVKDRPKYIIFEEYQEDESDDAEDVLKSNFFKFKTKLISKCEYYGIEFREEKETEEE